MDFIDRLNSIGERFNQLKDNVQTEEATKTAFIMPFISALGYDVFNPMEVIPEFIADIGTKKGEKVDYCIQKEEKPVIIIECKHWKEKMDIHKSQLHRYFHVVEARFAILTNGEKYQFFSDLVEANKMDDRPFLEFSITNVTEHLALELKKFRKETFDLESIILNASDLKYSKQIKEMLSKELKEPTEDFVKYFASRVYPGRTTSKVMEQFTPLVSKSVRQLLNEMINARLQNAISAGNQETITETPIQTSSTHEEVENEESIVKIKSGIETTEEELQAFRIVQAILRQHIDTDRIVHRDTKSYFGILLDDNNRKPICRLRLNSNTIYLSVFDTDKSELKHKLERLEDIYNYSEELLATVKSYDA